jgi:hypothetical protein
MLAPLCLVGELVPKLRDRAARVAIGVAAVTALVGLTMPLHLGIGVAIAAGIGAGLLSRRRPASAAVGEAS